MTDEWSDIGLGNFAKTQALKKTNPGMKTLLSFGGWTESLSGIYNVRLTSKRLYYDVFASTRLFKTLRFRNS